MSDTKYKFALLINRLNDLPQSEIPKAMVINLDKWLSDEPVTTALEVKELLVSEFPGLQDHKAIKEALLYIEGHIALWVMFGGDQPEQAPA